MPTLTNPQTGETKEITTEEFLKMMRSGNAEIRQVVTHADGTTSSNTLYGNLAEDGLDRSVNIFADKETFNAFLKRSILIMAGKLEEQETGGDPQEQFEMTVDFTENALMGILRKTKEELKIDIYTRDERRSTSSHLLEGSKTWPVAEDGSISFNPADLQGEDKTVCMYMLSFSQMRKFLRRCGKLEELKALGNRGSGVIIKATDQADDASATVVQGLARPDLPCEVFLLGQQLIRPYPDEMMSDMLYGDMSLEEKIAAAESGNTGLMEELAMYYLNGDFVEDIQPVPEKAVYWFRKMAQAGVASGMFNLGLHYAKGHGVQRDFVQAAHWMERAADAGDEDAPALLEKYRKAVAALEKIPSGDAQAQADLAGVLMALAGSLEQAGPGKDYEEAFDLAQKSAAQGCGDGIWTLALAYEHGRGVRRAVSKAIENYRRGADMGHAACQHSLACYYMRGEEVQKDMNLAFQLIMKSAEQGYGLAMKDAGRCYQFGHGVEDDMGKAIEWYEKSLQVLPDPELEQKVAIFRQLQDLKPDGGAETNLPEGYNEALQNFIDEEEAREGTNLAEAIRYLNAEFNPEKETACWMEEVAGTQFEGRNQRIERIRVGDVLDLVREPQNRENGLNISVRNKNGESLGNLSAGTCRLLAPVMDEGLVRKISAKVSEVIPLSKRGGRAKKSILKVIVTLDLHGMIPCTVCKLSGDQVNIWVQMLTVGYSTMPARHAAMLFELYNRHSGEYDKLDRGENDTSYAGLDNLEEEIRAAREQLQRQRVEGLDYSEDPTGDYESFGSYVLRKTAEEPARYGAMRRYEIMDYDRLPDILDRYTICEKKYYWVDQTRTDEEEFNESNGFNHWYEVMELYEGKDLPVDLADEDVVSIFGCGKFAAFADLSYGC